MTTEERKALRALSRAVRDGEAALEVVRAAKLDTVTPVSGLVERLRHLRKVNEERRLMMREVREALVLAGVDELNRPASAWTSVATIGAQLLALVGK